MIFSAFKWLCALTTQVCTQPSSSLCPFNLVPIPIPFMHQCASPDLCCRGARLYLTPSKRSCWQRSKSSSCVPSTLAHFVAPKRCTHPSSWIATLHNKAHRIKEVKKHSVSLPPSSTLLLQPSLGSAAGCFSLPSSFLSLSRSRGGCCLSTIHFQHY